MKKNIKIIIIVLISMLVLTIAAFAVIYFETGLFKTNKQMFNKYISQTDINSVINLEDTTVFAQRILNDAHSSNGKLAIVVKDLSDDEEEIMIDEEIDYQTKIDLQNKKAEGKFDISQDGEQKLTINYLNNDDLYGFQFEDMIKQFIVIDNNSIKDLTQKLGIDNEKTPDKVDAIEKNQEKNFVDSKDKLKEISKKYIDIIIDQIPEENYTKIKKENIIVGNKEIKASGYRLTLNQKEIIDIIIELLNAAKQDGDLFNVINDNLDDKITVEEYKEQIQKIANEIDRSDAKDQDKYMLTISVYKQGKKLAKINARLQIGESNNGAYIDFILDDNKKIQIDYVLNYEYSNYDNFLAPTLATENSEFSLAIEKDTSKGQEEGYKVVFSKKEKGEEELNIEFTFSRFGKYTSQNVKIDMYLNVKSDIESINVSLNDNTKFSIDEEIGEFEEGNYLVVNNLSEEQLSNLVINLGDMVSEKIDTDRSFFSIVLGLDSSLFKNAKKSVSETKKEQVKEAITLAKAEIIAEYYGGTLAEVNEGQITNKIKSYLSDEFGKVTVTKIEGEYQYVVSVEGVELDSNTNKIDLSVLYEE